MEGVTPHEPEYRGEEPGRGVALPETVGVLEYQLVLADPSGIEAEAIRGLRTRIVARHIREGRRALAICGPSAGVGCTFIAINLATALAQIGIRTALVDANLRDPAIGGAFNLDDQTGLTDYLSDPTTPIDTVIHKTRLPNLSIIPAGRLLNNPQELLSSEHFRDFTGQLLREFDITIFDTTASNSCTDAQRVANVVGYSLIVARKDSSYINDVATLGNLLRADRANVIGCVLNGY
ncbi:CpsD/CapB family tyrosine-protein kinase [Sphingomonas sp. dw_22]|uniref:CpsD/CapB family tyrosine-protein kinase n=1 Tax=Sphingomonas sp. dw_22 TaxID=2721175 RepID=UPI001BD58A8A|nr:CpsD/CapB family tyrosine-protein kinase [Sphingomonas sp. dw_22]